MYEEEDAPLTQTLNTFQMSLNNLEDDVRDSKSMQSILTEEMSSQREKICELQIKCQEEQHAIELLEEMKKNARDQLESGSSTLKKVESKQFEVNEKLKLIMKAYDSNYHRCQAVKQSFNEKFKVLNHFQSKQDQDLNDVATIGSATLELLKSNLEEKQKLNEQLKEFESSDESLDEQLTFLDNHLEMSNSQLENFKKTLSELKKEGEITIFKSNSLKSTIEQIETRANLNLDEWNSKWIREEEKLNEIKRSNEEYLNKIDRLKTNYKNNSNHLESERQRAQSLQQSLEELKEKNSTIESEISALKEKQKELIGVEDLIKQKESSISQIKKNKEEATTENKLLDENISSSENKLEQLLNMYSISQAEIAKMETEENLLDYIQLCDQAIVELKTNAEQKKEQNAAELKSLKQKLSEAKAVAQEKNKVCQESSLMLKSLQEELKNIQNEGNKKEVMIAEIDNMIVGVQELREKQKSLEEEKENYYNLYSARSKHLQKRQNEIEEAKNLNQKLNEAKAKFESFKEETLNKVKDQLKMKTDELLKSKTELKAKVDKEKAFMSKIQYDYYTSKNNYHESQKRLATLRAMSEIAQCENEAVKAFISWMTSGVDLSKYLKTSLHSQDQESQIMKKDEFLFSQMVDTINGSQDMEIDEIQGTNSQIEPMEKLDRERLSSPQAPYNKNKFTSHPEKENQSAGANSVINLISENDRHQKKIIKSECDDDVINLISSEGDQMCQPIRPRKILAVQNQNLQIKKVYSALQPSFKMPPAKDNRIFTSVKRNPFSSFGPSCKQSSRSLKHTYEPTKLYDSDTDNNPYALFASPKLEASGSSSKKPPKKSSQNSQKPPPKRSSRNSQKPQKKSPQKPQKKTTARKPTMPKKKDFDDKEHQDRVLNYIQSVQKSDTQEN